MTRTKPSLAAAVAKMQEPSAPPPRAKARAVGGETKQILTRIPPEAHRQLKYIAFDEGTEIQALMVEALNDLFVKRGKPPIA